MRVGQSAAGMMAKLQGDDLVVRPMPASGLLVPGANDAIVTPDGVIVVDAADNPLYFITSGGMVIGRTEHIVRDSRDASAQVQRHTQPAVQEPSSQEAPPSQEGAESGDGTAPDDTAGPADGTPADDPNATGAPEDAPV